MEECHLSYEKILLFLKDSTDLGAKIRLLQIASLFLNIIIKPNLIPRRKKAHGKKLCIELTFCLRFFFFFYKF